MEDTEKTTTKYELSDLDTLAHNAMLDIMAKPKFIQTYTYHRGLIPKQYSARVIVDKEDRISVIDKTFNLRIGTNGLFIKQGKLLSGVTYHKKGRSSARVRYWGSTGLGGNAAFSQYDTLIGVAKEINPSCMDILCSNVIKNIGTKGMFGSILAGKVDTTTKAMEYYIRYSLRGTGVDLTQADNMYKYIEGMKFGVYEGIKALRVAKDPNQVLELVNSNPTNRILKIITDNSLGLTDLALMCGEKIDWTAPGFTSESEYTRLSTKSQDIGKCINMWEGGVILRDKTHKPKTTSLMSMGLVEKGLPF
jgi:hypothetical protein